MFDFNKNRNFEPKDKPRTVRKLSEIIDICIPCHGEKAAIRFDRGTRYESLTYKEYLGYIRAFVQFLNRNNCEQKVIATMCKNRIEWDMTALASFYTGNIIFPIDTKTNSVELEHLLTIAPPDYAVISRPQLQRFRDMKQKCRLSTTIIIADIIEVFEDAGYESFAPAPDELSMASIYRQGDFTQLIAPAELLENPDTILGYYSTSGTTQLPKVVRITNNNIVSELNEGVDVINFRHNEDALNIGPYTHIATLVEFLVSKSRGFSVTYFTREADEDKVLENEITKLKNQNVRLRALMAVPKFWIFLLKDLLEEIKNKTYFKSIYECLVNADKNDVMVDIGTLDKAKLIAIRTLLRNKLGGYFSYGISSSMKLDGSMVEIFGKLGITVIDIYGATECTGIISRNRLNDLKPGSCGRIISVLDRRLENKRHIPGVPGEAGILNLKGPTLAHSYITDAGITENLNLSADGYFSTGDLCRIDADGWLYLIGREKELIPWDDGSLIDPQYVSNLLVKSIFVKDALVTRKNPADSELSVYLFPDYKKIETDREWKTEIATGVSTDAALKKRMIEAIRYAQSIARMSAVMNTDTIYLLPEKLERTPTHKIKFIFELQRLDRARSI